MADQFRENESHIENTLDQVRLAPASRPLEAQNRLLAWQCQVLHLDLALVRRSADEPDGLAAPCLGHDDPPSEEFAQRSAALAGLRTPKQAKVFGNAQTAVLTQVRLE